MAAPRKKPGPAARSVPKVPPSAKGDSDDSKFEIVKLRLPAAKWDELNQWGLENHGPVWHHLPKATRLEILINLGLKTKGLGSK
jgi:hypothetical protein